MLKKPKINMDRKELEAQCAKMNLSSNGIISFVSGSDKFKVGDKVKLRGDMGGLRFTITSIANSHYCTAEGYGKQRHFNMAFLEHVHVADLPEFDFSKVHNDSLIVIKQRNLIHVLNICFNYGYYEKDPSYNGVAWEYDCNKRSFFLDNFCKHCVSIIEDINEFYVIDIHLDIKISDIENGRYQTRGLICALLSLNLATLHETNERTEAQ